MSVDRYKQIANGLYKFMEPKIKTSVPTPTEDDYKNGFIVRYFCQRTNDKNGPILEIDSSNYSKINSNKFYTVVSIRWRISGNIEPIYDSNGNIKYKSVQESNRLSIKLVEDSMPNLKLYLPNLLQFHK